MNAIFEFLFFPLKKAGEEFAKGVRGGVTHGMTVSTGLLTSIEEAVKNIFSSIGSSFKENFQLGGAGKHIGEQFGEFIKKIDLEKLFGDIAKQFSGGMKGAAENLDFKNPGQTIGKQFGEGLKGIGKPLTDAFGEVTGELFKNLTWNTVPYLASGGLVVTGIPLGTLYAYHRAKNNIGKPKLASEVRKVGILDQMQEKTMKVFKGTLEVVGSGLKWGLAVGGAALAGYLPSLIGCAVMAEDRKAVDHFDSAYRIGAQSLTVGVGLSASLINLFTKVKNWGNETFFMPPPPKPIFNKDLTAQINEIVFSTNNLKKNGGYFQNVLLYGPGGTGKTMVAKMIAKNSNMNYVMMSGGDLAQYIKRGEHVTELNKLFESIKSSSSPTILFIDEMESLCGDRKKMDRSELFELLNAFLSHTGEASKQVMIIGATNIPELIDEAVLSRMDRKLEIAPPDVEQRLAILTQYIERFFKASEREEFFSKDLIQEMARKTDGLTGRAVFKMINALSSKKMAKSDNKLTKEDILSVVNQFVSQEENLKRVQSRPSTQAGQRAIRAPQPRT